MVATRRSARIASQGSENTGSPVSQASPNQSAGAKRKSEPGQSPSAKRGKKHDSKEQKTLEETLPTEGNEQAKPEQQSEPAQKDVEMSDAPNSETSTAKPEHKPDAEAKSDQKPADQPAHEQPKSEPQPTTQTKVDEAFEKKSETEPREQEKPDQQTEQVPHEEPKQQDKVEEQQTHEQPRSNEQPKSDEQPKSNDEAKSSSHDGPKQDGAKQEAPKHETQPNEAQNHTKKPDTLPQQDSHPQQSSTNGDNAVIPQARSEEEPSNILEKGIIYFLYRGRVGIDDPSNVGDIARSYMLLRPLPEGAKLGDGPIGDERNCRLLALPKKVLPLSGKDRWTAFVEKANTSFKELKDSFLGPSDYTTQTAGVRHSPAVVPAAEGVYAITTTGRESHLAYMMTLPTSPGEIQSDLGLREKGSFVTSVKNPKYPGPANADIGKDPGYSQEILDEFRNLRWGPLQPKHLNYEGCQFLLVGESSGIENATGQPAQDADGQQPKQELEKLEGEDEIRVKHLHGDDAVFADLGTDSKSYSGMQTTW